MRVMILGAGYNQLYAIEKIQSMGYQAVASDYNVDSPGKKIADLCQLASTFSYEETLAAAKEAKIDALYTSGSDQPVYIAAKVSETLGLYSNLDSQTAHLVTNKKAMKERFTEAGIPFLKSQLVDESIEEACLEISFPAVLKPQDSQGQRGLYLVHSYQEMKNKLRETLKNSRQKQAILESYYPSDEITISGWVRHKKVKIISVCDRLRFSDERRLGICVAHEYPSKHFDAYGDQIRAYTNRIVESFGIENGPIYFQMLIGRDGLFVNEIACRIGGAYEDMYIEKCLGLDIARLQILEVLNKASEKEYHRLQAVEFPAKKYLSVELFFARPGTVARVSSKQSMCALQGVVDASIFYQVEDTIVETKRASQRAGFAIICAPDRKSLKENIDQFYQTVRILDESGRNLMLKRGIPHER